MSVSVCLCLFVLVCLSHSISPEPPIFYLPARRCASTGTIAMALCPSVSVSMKRNERIKLLFGTEASFDQSYTVFYGNSNN